MRDINLRDAYRTVDAKFRAQFVEFIENLPEERKKRRKCRLLWGGIAISVLLLALMTVIFWCSRQ